MRPVNLGSVVSANRGLSNDKRDELYGLWGISPKTADLVSLELFVDALFALVPKNSKIVSRLFGGCYFGFVIPRISKEFDCLWVGKETIVNVELKSRDVGSESIIKQHVRNKYYLQHLDRTILSFSYVASSGECFFIDDNLSLNRIPINRIASALARVHKEPLFLDRIESLFPPERFLVSPFNATKDFLGGLYFLTNQQRDFKTKIMCFLSNKTIGCFCALTGGPGTGKSLLLYDIARDLMTKGAKVVIGHSGGLNSGHNELIHNGWRIKSTKSLVSQQRLLDPYEIVDKDVDVFIIDEAQRCYPYIMDALCDEIERSGKKCIFSFDAEQIMSDDELKRRNGERIQSIVKDNCYTLSSSIRTNSDVYGFIKALFDLRHPSNVEACDHVDISFCRTVEEAADLLECLRKEGYHVPKFTPRLHGSEDYEAWFPFEELSAHEVIGQEFDNVVGLLSDKLYYKDGKLVSRGRYYYREDKMLYQILTRARHKVHLVIVNNPIVLDRCLRLLGN